MHQFVDREVSGNRSEESLDGVFITVDIQQTANKLRGANRVDSLYVHLDEFGEVVLVQVKNEVVNKVETVADNYERKLVGKLCLFEEVLGARLPEFDQSSSQPGYT